MKFILVNQFYTPDTAATGQLLTDLAEHLMHRGHEVHVICSRGSYSGGDRTLAPRETRQGVHVHRVGATGFGRTRTGGRLLDYGTYYVLALAKAFRISKPDACLTLTTPPLVGGIGYLLKICKRVPYAIWCMDLYPEVAAAYGALSRSGITYKLLQRINRRIHQSSFSVIALGHCMRQRLQETGVSTDHITVIPNWAPGKTPVPPPAAVTPPPASDEQVTLMYSGNLGAGHDFDTILGALQEVPESLRPAFLITGAGKREPIIRDAVKKHNLDHSVRIETPVPLDQLFENLLRGDIHLVSQRPGTAGLIVPSKVYSLLACGRPILFIGPPECEAAELVQKSQCGYVIAPGDQETACRRMEELCRNPALRRQLGEQARTYYDVHLGRDASLTHFAEVLEGQGGNPPPGSSR